MAYLVVCIYKPGQEQVRARFVTEHVQHFAANLPHILYGGSLRGDDGESSVGSMFALDYATRDEVTKFLRGDPFHRHELFESVTVHRLVPLIPETEPGALLRSIQSAPTSHVQIS